MRLQLLTLRAFRLLRHHRQPKRGRLAAQSEARECLRDVVTQAVLIDDVTLHLSRCNLRLACIPFVPDQPHLGEVQRGEGIPPLGDSLDVTAARRARGRQCWARSEPKHQLLSDDCALLGLAKMVAQCLACRVGR
eukprot:7391817-Prymnesium_polylepis.1